MPQLRAVADFVTGVQCVFVKVYCIGTVLSMQISFVGFQPVQSGEHMAVCMTCSVITDHFVIMTDE